MLFLPAYFQSKEINAFNLLILINLFTDLSTDFVDNAPRGSITGNHKPGWNLTLKRLRREMSWE